MGRGVTAQQKRIVWLRIKHEYVTIYIISGKLTSRGESGSSRMLFSFCIRCIVPVELGSIISTF